MAPSSPFLVFWSWAHLALQGRSKRSVSSHADGTITTGHWSPDHGSFCLEGFPIESHQLFTLQIISTSTYHVLGTSGVKVKGSQSRQTLRDPMDPIIFSQLRKIFGVDLGTWVRLLLRMLAFWLKKPFCSYWHLNLEYWFLSSEDPDLSSVTPTVWAY